MHKKTLVLDLDETLVHSAFKKFDKGSDIILKIELEGRYHDIHVLVRAGVDEFLEKMSKHYELIVFTASLSKYAEPLVDRLDPKGVCYFRLFREHCTMINGAFVKDLKRLDRDLKDVIILDVGYFLFFDFFILFFIF
jgi:RNA polymerase II subunit A small phosphatase-like protein